MITGYQLFDRLCTTAGSDVYSALRVQDGACIALKLLESGDMTPARAARFRREYACLQTLEVTHVVKPDALVDEHGQLAMTFGTVTGESLEAVLKRGRIDLPTCLIVGRQLADILAGLHAARLIHRDIRPINFLMTLEETQIRLLDLSAAICDAQQIAAADDLPAGDWAYLSPEQTGRMNRTIDYRTDFYSLGIMLYHMLTGQLPFTAADPLEWAHCHIARIPRSPRDLDPEVPQMVSDIVMKLLAKLPEDRYQSAYGLRHDLDECWAQWQATGGIDTFPLATEDFSDRFQISHKLYGREPEAAVLLDAFERMSATGERAFVTVSGTAGVGKSSLIDALRQPIVEKQAYFIAGKFDQYLRDIPYAIIAQAFRQLVQQLLAQSEAHIAGWRQRIQQAVGANGQLIIDVLPQVDLIIGRQPPVRELPPREAQHRFRRVFRQFLNVFTQKEHPLVLFLDDLQWIDAASLQLIEFLFTDADTRYLLLIAAYRDNEVDAMHPLPYSVKAIRQSNAAMSAIELVSLSIESLNQLVADTLHTPTARCEPLTRLIFAKTDGNPFFFTQFFASLHKEDLLRYVAQDRCWHWDLEQITAKDFADNVVGLMVGKLRRFPAPMQELLQLAACLGNKFDLHLLALLSRTTQDQVEQSLTAALHEGLIMMADGAGKFLHDRIQQAAYSLMSPQDCRAMHLRIGRVLLATLGPEELASQLFDVVNQFNLGAILLIDPQEKAQVAELNLRAGQRAKASTAYASACVYLAAGMALLEESDWEYRYALMFSLWFERANCEFLSGNFEEVARLIAVLQQQAMSNVDRAAVYSLKIFLHVIRSENPQAMDRGFECLHLLGIDIPAHPTWEQVHAEYDMVWGDLEGRSIESLIDLPLMTDPDMQAAMKVIANLMHPSGNTDINVTRVLFCRMVRLSLKYGVNGAAAYGHCAFAQFVGPDLHRYHDAYRFAQLAIGLVEKHDFLADKARTYFSMSVLAAWTQPITTPIDYAQEAFRIAIETGDIPTACYSWVIALPNLWLRGAHLDDMWRTSEQALDFIRKSGFRDMGDMIVSHQRLILAMQGRTASLATFSDVQFDEAAFEAQMIDAQMTGERTQSMCYWYWSLKLEARFLAGDYAAALAAAEQAKPLLWTVTGMALRLYYYTTTALTITAVYDTATPDEQRAWREQLAAHETQLREWAEVNPPTFGDKHALVAAEIARIDGREIEAMRLYQQAITSAHDNGFIQNEGIARELAARFYLARGFQTEGDAHLAEARHCFARWGADGKVAQLEARYPQLRPSPTAPSAISAGQSDVQLDMLSVAKASQAISGQILMNGLVDTLMRTVLENASAQNGALLLMRNEELTLAADARMDEQSVEVRSYLGQMPPPFSPLPAAILNYVRRSREQVLLDDVTQPNPFSDDEYFSDRHPKSALCLPILRQAALVGVLYLENNLVTYAFTPARLTVLEMLAAQAAISLENALLYTDLHEREARIHRLVESNIIGIIFWDLGGRISEANEAFLQLVGYSRQDVLSGNVKWTSMTPPEYNDVDAQAIEALNRTGISPRYEKEFICKDGHRVPVLIAGALLEGSQSQGVAFVLDMTEQKRAEARIHRLVESNIIGVIFWDVHGDISDANEAFLQLVGYSRQDVLSGNFKWTSMTPPEHRDADTQAIQEIKRTGNITRYEKELIHKDGHRVPVLIGATFLHGSQEQGVAFVLDQTEQKQAEARIGYMARYDALTGLPNRILLQDRIEQAIAYARRDRARMGVLFLDIDHFKFINDSLGHSAGDLLLQTIALRLRECLREGDSVARWGGDEFVLSLPLLASSHDAARVAQKVLDVLGRAFVIEGHELHMSGSIGISLYPEDGTNMESLMRTADIAMYHAKENGRGNFQFFTPALNQAAQQRLAVANHLSQALARDEFVLYYQPQVDLETGKIFAGEALLRWQQPNTLPVSCSAFIAAAEESGLILPIGEWVLQEACRQLRQWRDAGYPQLRIAVNVSTRQFYQRNFLGMIERILRETELPANTLELEITEGLLLQHSDATLETLNRLCDMGIQLSVDDFGTGYSSLAYLHRFPIKVLKIDQSFVRGIGKNSSETALVAAIIAMANSLHLKVVAEGAETLQQIAFLRSHGCLAAQGFYYSEPVPPDAFFKMLGKPFQLSSSVR